jgi:Tol biopolymer transport system component
MKKSIIFSLIALALSIVLSPTDTAAQKSQSADVLLGAALHQEEVEGNLEAAIETYKKLLAEFPGNRPLAAKAQLHLGLCYEKLGLKQAQEAFQKVVENYPEQSEAVKAAQAKLALLLKAQTPAAKGDKEFHLSQVWSGSGAVDTSGAVSPDGRYLSFVDWETGDLAIRELATATNRRLTNKGSWTQSPEFALFSKWSPDSRRIVYQWYNKDEVYELRVINIKESTPRVLYRNRKKEDYVQAFDWSPDGKHVLAAFFGGPAPIDGKEIQLGLVSAEDGSVKIIKTHFEPRSGSPEPWGFAFSPDGKYIAYDTSPAGQMTGERNIFLITSDGNLEIPLVEHPAGETVIGWTPDGQGLLFTSSRTGSLDAWFIRIVGGKPQGAPQLVKPDLGPIEPMGFTSQGALFYGLGGGATDVYVAGIDSQTGKILSPAKKTVLPYEGHNAYPAYSPDGKQLAYISSRRSLPVRSQQIRLCILTLKTGQIQEMGPDLGKFGYPRWATDGRSVSVWGASKDGRLGIYRIDVQTGDVVPIVQIDKGREIFSHRWSKDGKVLYYTIGDRAGKACSVFVHNFESGREERLSGSPDDAYEIDISQDGKRLVLLNRERKRVIRIMPTSGGEPREIYSFEQEGNHIITPAWSADGRYIYFPKLQKFHGDLWDLYRVSVDGGEAQKIDLAMAQPRHLSVNPDGQYIAFSSMGANPEQAQVWVMENFLPKEKSAGLSKSR